MLSEWIYNSTAAAPHILKQSQKAGTALAQPYPIQAERTSVPFPAGICRSGRQEKEKQRTVVLTNQINNIECLEKESEVRNSDLLRICHQNKHQNHKTPHKEEPETKSLFIHPLKNVVVQSICSVIHKSLTPLNYSDKAHCTTTKTLVFSQTLHH